MRLKAFTVIDGKIKRLFNENAYDTRMGANSLLIYRHNGHSYLYCYKPDKWLDNGEYSHEIFCFDNQGQRLVLDKGDISFGNGLDLKLSSKKVKQYIEKNLQYIENSTLLASTYSKEDFYNEKNSENDNPEKEYISIGYTKNNYKEEFAKYK